MFVDTSVLSYLKLKRANSIFNFRFFDDRDDSEDENSLPGILLYTVKYGTPEGTFPFRYLSEKKLKQGN